MADNKQNQAPKEQAKQEAPQEQKEQPTQQAETKQEEKAEAPKEQAKASGARVVNDKRKGKVSVAGNELALGESLQLTAEQKKDERLMAKIKHGHKNELWTFAE